MRILPLFFVLVLAAGCGKQSAEELFHTGEQAQKEAEEGGGLAKQIQDSLFQKAIDSYEAVVDDYPDNELAEAALFRIAELHNNGTRRYLDAVKAYERFRSIYPASPRAPVSLFMIAFLYNNELHDLEKAAAAYKQFLNQYPDHELAVSAAAELENIGKSPEEIIEKQVASAKKGNKGNPGTP